jgi:adenylylsulfate kinase
MPDERKSTHTRVHNGTVTRARREHLNAHRSVIVWFTGLSGAGKSTLANAVEERLHLAGYRTYVLDGDNVRQGLCADLGFSPDERMENIRRVRALVPDGDFIEIHCRCSLAVCEERDVKGLYRLARMGAIAEFTGISSPYEVPEAPELTIDTGTQRLAESVDDVMALLQPRLLVGPLRARL